MCGIYHTLSSLERGGGFSFSITMKPLTPAEVEVMQVLWDSGPLKPAEIQEKFPRPIQNAALRSLLLVLLEKGHVRRRKDGKAYYYEATTPRDSAFRNMVRRIADAFFGGSTVSLVAELVKEEELNAEDLRDLQKIASAGVPPTPRKKEPKR